MTDRLVVAGDGVELAVFEAGVDHDSDGATPIVLLVHGYPDDHHVWDGLAASLSTRDRVVRYDVRGAGRSGRAAELDGYRIDQLVDDVFRVIGAIATPVRPVHVVAHDWGSIQCWRAASDPRANTTIASYTSISGPDLAYAGHWLRTGLRTPGRRRSAVHQAVRSSYIGLFLLPALPEWLWRHGVFTSVLNGHAFRRSSAPKDRRRETDAVNGLSLYRANFGRRAVRLRPRATAVPCLVIAPSGDRFVGADLQQGAPAAFAADLRTATVSGGHWVVRDHPDRIIALIQGFVDDHQPDRNS
ncbi:MAG: alpha/beta fold hydrolase [Actinobacteria bacterium]|nr:alpha/beta fold hydrolase [Actinomycetota bacterium]